MSGRQRRRLRPSRGALAALALVVGGGVAAGALVTSLRETPRELSAEGTGGPERQATRPRLRTVLAQPRLSRGTGAPSRRGGGAAVGAPGSVRIPHVPGQLLVKFEEDASRAEVAGALDRADADPTSVVPELGVRVVEVAPPETREAVDVLATSPAVDYVERDVAVEMLETTPNDPMWPAQWGPLVVGATTAWDVTQGAEDVVVAVLDTGADAAHPDLQGALVPGVDLVNGDDDPNDDNGHGTSAAGIVAARTNNYEGNAGMCWRCRVMPVKVLGADGLGTSATVAEGIVWAVDHGADVISMSFGGPATTLTLQDAVQYAASKGVVLVAAAGNSGSADLSYPAAYSEVLSVAATTEDDALYSWSNSGAWVQVAAPGCNVAPAPGGQYVSFCGTSSAAPVVAGLAALLLSAQHGLDKAGVEQAIRASTVPVSSAIRNGRVRADAAVLSVGIVPPAAPAPSASPARPVSADPTTEPTTEPAPAEATGSKRTTHPRTTTFTGRLGAREASRTFSRALTAGRVDARLTFPAKRNLTLRVLDADGASVARVAGRSPLRVSTDVSAGTYRFVVAGEGKKAAIPFSLRVASTPTP